MRANRRSEIFHELHELHQLLEAPFPADGLGQPRGVLPPSCFHHPLRFVKFVYFAGYFAVRAISS